MAEVSVTLSSHVKVCYFPKYLPYILQSVPIPCQPRHVESYRVLLMLFSNFSQTPAESKSKFKKNKNSRQKTFRDICIQQTFAKLHSDTCVSASRVKNKSLLFKAVTQHSRKSQIPVSSVFKQSTGLCSLILTVFSFLL